MDSNSAPSINQAEAIDRGFSKQSVKYDAADSANIILQDLRRQVYDHVQRFLRPASKILELNAGTGIDAAYFASMGHHIVATDLSSGMISQINQKISSGKYENRLSSKRMSFEDLNNLRDADFDYVFSNFGGLNCIEDLSRVTRHLPNLLKSGGYVTWVIMPPVCPWELLWLLKGDFRMALRRVKPNGAIAHLEGEHFKTYYHSFNKIRSAFGDSFSVVRLEGLAALSPQPHYSYIPLKYQRFYRATRWLDGLVKNFYPFNRWADHLVVTLKYTPAGAPDAAVVKTHTTQQ